MSVTSAKWHDSLEYAALTDVGMRRANNQDSHRILLASDMEEWERRGHFFMVADGMGAHAAGELASKLAVDGVPTYYLRHADLPPPEALERAFRETNADVHRRGEANADFRHMGTTGSALLLLPQGALAGQIGDSRIYRLRRDRLEQLTFDHSLVWELRASGQVSPDTEFARSLPKNVITRSIGPNPTVQCDLEGPLPTEVGDTFLLCSDGLTGQVKDEELGPILGALSPSEAVRVLVDLANLRGGPDNVTVIVVRVTGRDVASPNAGAFAQGETPRAAVHPALWAAPAVGLLGALALLILELWPVAAVLGGLSLIAALVAVVLRFRPLPASAPVANGKRLGKGPYTTLNCPPNKDFIGKLADIVKEIRTTATEKRWRVNWSRVDEFLALASAAAKKSDLATAVREHAHALSFVMEELRRQNDKQADDSDARIDY